LSYSDVGGRAVWNVLWTQEVGKTTNAKTKKKIKHENLFYKKRQLNIYKRPCCIQSSWNMQMKQEG